MPPHASRAALVCACAISFSALTVNTAPDPEVFPGASFDAKETAALATDNSAPRVFRTPQDFDVVVNYYRFKRKQGVNIVKEPLAAPFQRIGTVLARGGSKALLASRFVQDFHQHVFGARTVEPAKAAPAWHDFATRIAGPMQRIGEGNRVTIYRPYVSRSTFSVIEDTVIILHNTRGGTR
jgi:hypothetical protein